MIEINEEIGKYNRLYNDDLYQHKDLANEIKK
jgi:hypothetical protein